MESLPGVNEEKSRAYFLFPFAVGDGSATDLGSAIDAVLAKPLSDLVCLPFFPEAVRRVGTRAGEDASEPARPGMAEKRSAALEGRLWHPAPAGVSVDLHPHIRMLLGQREKDAVAENSVGSKVPPMQSLSPEATNVLSGRWGARGQGFDVLLSRSARRRLGLPENEEAKAGLRIEAGHLQFFATGIGILVLECAYCRAPKSAQLAEVILEVNYQLSHLRQGAQSTLRWAGAGEGEGSASGVSLLDEIAAALVAGSRSTGAEQPPVEHREVRWLADRRAFVYTALQFTGSFGDGNARQEYAHRLCSRYTMDYGVRRAHTAMDFVSPFDNVLHGASIEGGCVLVEESDQVEFLKTYVSKVVRQAYLPLALVSLHEFHHLLRVAQESALFVPQDRPSEHDLVRLRDLRLALINFHLYFRFSHASMLTPQNAVHSAWRRALDLERMLKEVTGDVVEAEKLLSANAARLEAEAERAQERRWRVWGTVGTWVATYLTLSHLLDIWVGRPFLEAQLQLAYVKVQDKAMTVAEYAAQQSELHMLGMLLEFAAMLLAVGAAVFVYFREPKGQSHGVGH